MSSKTKPSLSMTWFDGSFSETASAAISVKSRTSKPWRRQAAAALVEGEEGAVPDGPLFASMLSARRARRYS
jgi:hypothetical protein